MAKESREEKIRRLKKEKLRRLKEEKLAAEKAASKKKSKPKADNMPSGDGWRKIDTVKNFVNIKEAGEGDILIDNGVYLGTTPNKRYKNRVCHEFREANGETKVLNDYGHLNHQIDSDVSVGDTVRVVYLGSSVMKDGPHKGEEAQQFEVFVKGSGKSKNEEDSDDEIEEDYEEEEKPKKGKVKSKKKVEEDEDDEDSLVDEDDLDEEEDSDEDDLEDLDLDDLED